MVKTQVHIQTFAGLSIGMKSGMHEKNPQSFYLEGKLAMLKRLEIKTRMGGISVLYIVLSVQHHAWRLTGL